MQGSSVAAVPRRAPCRDPCGHTDSAPASAGTDIITGVSGGTVLWLSGPNSAIDDITYLPKALRMQLVAMSHIALVESPRDELSADEGELDGGLLYRRAATRDQMAALSALDDGHPSTPSTIDYFFIYRTPNARERQLSGSPRFVVHRVLDVQNLAWLLEQFFTQPR